MSYARFSDDSSVYVFLAVNGHLECCACLFAGGFGGGYCAYSTQAMLDHLQEHIDAGHDVPDSCIERLKENREANDAYIRGHKDAPALISHESSDDD